MSHGCSMHYSGDREQDGEKTSVINNHNKYLAYTIAKVPPSSLMVTSIHSPPVLPPINHNEEK